MEAECDVMEASDPRPTSSPLQAYSSALPSLDTFAAHTVARAACRAVWPGRAMQGAGQHQRDRGLVLSHTLVCMRQRRAASPALNLGQVSVCWGCCWFIRWSEASVRDNMFSACSQVACGKDVEAAMIGSYA